MALKHYVHDQSQVVLLFESGTYGTASGAGVWIGDVQDNDIDDDEGRGEVRTVGGGDRNVNAFYDGATTNTATINFWPQDWRTLQFALGKVVDGGSPSPYTHTYTEVNNDNQDRFVGEVLPTFQIEDAQRATTGSNFIRTIKGCMCDNYNINIPQNEPITVSMDYVGQTVPFSSGAATAVTEDNSTPYLHHHTAWVADTTGSLDYVKNSTINIGNNLNHPDYSDGSRDKGTPIPTNRDHEVTLTMNSDVPNLKILYDQFYKGGAGSEFNMQSSHIISAGSEEIVFTYSGCTVKQPFSAPTGKEGIAEHTITIQPKSVSAVEINTVQYFAAGSAT